MPRFRLISDAHLEFYPAVFLDITGAQSQELVNTLLPPLPADDETVLIIAGDLGLIRRPTPIITFLRLVQPRFQHVIYVLGNHEYYHEELHTGQATLVKELQGSGIDLGALTLIGNECKTVTIDGVRFIGATLWTNYLSNNKAAKDLAQARLNDHRLISTKGRFTTPADLLEVFSLSTVALERELRGSSSTPTVVITHHLPSFDAVAVEYLLTAESRMLNGAFASDLNPLMVQYSPAYWCFGHTHHPYRGKVGNTTLLCNPVGYPGEKNVAAGKYDPALVIDL